MATAILSPAIESIAATDPGSTVVESLEAGKIFRVAQAQVSGVDISAIVFDSVPSARPTSLQLGTISHPNLRIRKAIPLEVSQEEGHVVLTWNDVDEFSCGESTGEALDQFSRSISELYFDLNDPNVKLSTHLEKARDVLNQHIEKRK